MERPPEAKWPDWSGPYRDAFEALTDDRFFGAMGGIGRIYYTAIDCYAVRLGLSDYEFDRFRVLVRALDDEYVAWVREKQAEELERNKTNPET
jgi:hypothetical protein